MYHWPASRHHVMEGTLSLGIVLSMIVVWPVSVSPKLLSMDHCSLLQQFVNLLTVLENDSKQAMCTIVVSRFKCSHQKWVLILDLRLKVKTGKVHFLHMHFKELILAVSSRWLIHSWCLAVATLFQWGSATIMSASHLPETEEVWGRGQVRHVLCS